MAIWPCWLWSFCFSACSDQDKIVGKGMIEDAAKSSRKVRWGMKTDSRWSVATGEDDGKPLIIRIRNQAPAFATKAHFPHLLGVSWQYESPNDQGMPSSAEAQRMSELEDLLEAGLEGSRQAFLTVIVTGNGVREWQWYARDPETIMDLVNKTLGHLEPFPVQFSFQDDPEWEAYSRFLGITGAEA